MQQLSGPEASPISGGKAKQLIIFLHGVGADGNDLFSLKDMFSEVFPDAHFASPNAPFPCDMAPYGYQWFSLLDRSADSLHDGVKTVEPILNNYIDNKLSELGLSNRNLAIIGFSQGTMSSLHTLPRRKNPVAAFVGYSGAMIKPELLQSESTAKPPICLIHGDADMVVPFESMKNASQALQSSGFEVETHARHNLGHGIDPEGIAIALKFLKTHLK